MLKPRMNNPCPQDYSKMSPAENGRFCAQCCKVVVDFTKKTAEEIFEFLKANSGTCGRFLHSQLQPARLPAETGRKLTGRLRRFSAAVYFVFGALLFSNTACGGQVEYYDYAVDSAQQAQQKATTDPIAKADSARIADSLAKANGQP